MKNTVIILSALKLWSITKGKGAPSFFNTVKGYAGSDFDTILINPETEESIADNGLQSIRHIYIEPYQKTQPGNKVGKWLYNNAFQAHYNKAFERELERILPGMDPTKVILYAYEVAAVPAAKKLSQKYHIKLVTRFQGTILGGKAYTFVNRMAYINHYRALSTPSDLVIMTNDGTLGDRVLRQLGNQSPTCFWRNGINRPAALLSSESASPSDKTDERVLMTVSRLAPWKRVDRAINAMPDVLEKVPSCKLYIAGDGQEKENLIELAQKLNVSEHVVFLGSIPQNEVYKYLKRADIFLSLYDLSNVGNPLYEAMMCGKAIITLNNGDTASVIKDGETGVLLEMKDAENCSQSIIQLLQDQNRLEKLGAGAKKYAEDNFWTWDERIQEELRTVKKLISDER